MLVNANVSRSVLSGIRSEDPRDTQKPKVLHNGAKKKKKIKQSADMGLPFILVF